LALEGIDDVHGSHGLTTSMLGVGDGITNDVLEEDFEDTTSLFINETRDTLHTTTASKTTNRRLGDTLDGIADNLAMALSTTLSKSFTTFTTSRHFLLLLDRRMMTTMLVWGDKQIAVQHLPF